ncbi:MAG: hypothetical protein K2X87_24780 [Gemmataceae bacterium]|nr:hypothetical protein [Gemmataceae bacterium]
MSALLDRAVAEARKLPDAEQDALAALILDEIEDDRRWDEAFAKSPGKLAALATRAAEQVRAGQCRAAGFDEL